MNKEINLFNNKEIESFGGKSLQENVAEAEKAIAELAEDFRIHNHSNTQFSWNHFVLNHKGGLRNARQITAEINKKTMALSEAKHRHNQKVIEIKILQEQVGKPAGHQTEDPRLIEAEIAKLTDEIQMSLAPIEGAIKDILILKKIYDQIMKDNARYTEADLEREEIAYWIRRLFSQALRDMRQSGVILNGNQEAIEQLGLNIIAVGKDLTAYLQKEANDQSLSNGLLKKFLEQSVDKYSDTVKNFIGYGGFDGAMIEASTFNRN